MLFPLSGRGLEGVPPSLGWYCLALAKWLDSWWIVLLLLSCLEDSVSSLLVFHSLCLWIVRLRVPLSLQIWLWVIVLLIFLGGRVDHPLSGVWIVPPSCFGFMAVFPPPCLRCVSFGCVVGCPPPRSANLFVVAFGGGGTLSLLFYVSLLGLWVPSSLFFRTRSRVILAHLFGSCRLVWCIRSPLICGCLIFSSLSSCVSTRHPSESGL